VARFYSLLIRQDLLVRVVLVRNWGCIGTDERELMEEFPCEFEAGQALEAVARRSDGVSIGIGEASGATTREPGTAANLKISYREA
jgi:predicted DNA-binding WGR domain protein